MERVLKAKNKITIITVFSIIAFFATNLSYLPYFTTSGRTQLLSYSAWGLMLVGILFTRALKLRRESLRFLAPLVVFFALIFVFHIFSSKNYFSASLTKCIEIAAVIFIVGELIGVNGSIDGNEYRLFKAYVLATFILSIVVYFTYLAGQDLSSRIYAYSSKNELAFIEISAVILLLFEKDIFGKSGFAVFIRSIGTVFLCIMIALMRCRSMLICIPIILIFFLLQTNSPPKLKFLIVIFLLLFAISLTNDKIYNIFINGIVYAGRDNSSLDSLSSGRLSQISLGWNRFINSPWIGTGNTSTIDCFFVSALMQYGIFAGVTLIFISLYPLAWGIKNRVSENHLYSIMILLALCYLIGGIFEENAPFGPGTRCYILWFLFGYLHGRKGMPYEGDRY